MSYHSITDREKKKEEERIEKERMRRLMVSWSKFTAVRKMKVQLCSLICGRLPMVNPSPIDELGKVPWVGGGVCDASQACRYPWQPLERQLPVTVTLINQWKYLPTHIITKITR